MKSSCCSPAPCFLSRSHAQCLRRPMPKSGRLLHYEFSISPSAILGDQFHEAIATVSMHVARILRSNGTTDPETTGVQHATCLSGWLTIVGELGYTVGCSNRGISGGSGNRDHGADCARRLQLHFDCRARHNYGPAMYFLGEPTNSDHEVDPVRPSPRLQTRIPICPVPTVVTAAPYQFHQRNTWITQQDYSIPAWVAA